MAPRFLLASFVIFAAVAGCGGVSIEPTTSEANPLDAEESYVIHALSDYRTNAGVPALTPCASLNVSASKHADDMRDKGYLTEKAPDGSHARDRACAAGYEAACGDTASIAEVVGSGSDDGKTTLQNWEDDPSTNALLLNAKLVAAGIGRSLNGDQPVWSLDMGSAVEASCKAK